MAQKRYINTSFWKDGYVVTLDPTEKFIFLYLLTNPQTNIAGIYEITLREIAFDTGYDDEMVKKILMRFERDNKVVYRGGWMILRNWEKHQSGSPKVETGIKRIKDSLPDWLQDLLKELKAGQRTLLNELEI